MNVTEEDRKEFPCHTESSIIGIKVIRGKDTDTLRSMIESNDTDMLNTLVSELESTTDNFVNPLWVECRVVEHLYSCGKLDTDKFNSLLQRIG